MNGTPQIQHVNFVEIIILLLLNKLFHLLAIATSQS